MRWGITPHVGSNPTLSASFSLVTRSQAQLVAATSAHGTGRSRGPSGSDASVLKAAGNVVAGAASHHDIRDGPHALPWDQVGDACAARKLTAVLAGRRLASRYMRTPYEAWLLGKDVADAGESKPT